MTGTLAVALNRDEPRTIEGPRSFEADDSFRVELANHGQPVHVHLRPDDALSRVARVEATNHYVDSGDTRYVDVHVDAPEDARVEGRLEVTTNYGAVTHTVAVAIDTTEPERVEVDPGLSSPGERQEPSLLEEAGAVPVILSLGVAFLLAGAALLVNPTLAVLFGGLAVVSLLVGVTVAVARRR